MPPFPPHLGSALGPLWCHKPSTSTMQSSGHATIAVRWRNGLVLGRKMLRGPLRTERRWLSLGMGRYYAGVKRQVTIFIHDGIWPWEYRLGHGQKLEVEYMNQHGIPYRIFPIINSALAISHNTCTQFTSTRRQALGAACRAAQSRGTFRKGCGRLRYSGNSPATYCGATARAGNRRFWL